MKLILGIGLVVALIIAIKAYSRMKRRQRLLVKYGDKAIVDRIMKGRIWQGMSEAQLIDSWGKPVATDQRIYKTKVAETFKYNKAGKNRFHSRVYVENGVVVGWEKK